MLRKRVTLAVILLFSIFCTGWAKPWVSPEHLEAPQSVASAQTADKAPGPDQSQPPAQNGEASSQSPGTAGTPATSSGKTTPAKGQSTTPTKTRRKKKTQSTDCGKGSAGTGDAASKSTATGANSSAPANCPPSKMIVRQGGTSDSSIQLAGGGAKSPQRDNANQMLAATEANLKKLSGQQLNSNQQDMLTQIRQFMEQSKAAVNDGDVERARTLAWKAQVLSDELVKPPE